MSERLAIALALPRSRRAGGVTGGGAGKCQRCARCAGGSTAGGRAGFLVNPAERLGIAWAVVLLLLVTMIGQAQGTVVTPEIHSHEAAFVEAAVVARGDIVAFDQQRGATLRVRQVLRGDAGVGVDYLLKGSAGYSFLATLPSDVTAFASRLEDHTLLMWQGPTNGGLIFGEPLLLEQIRRAHADPRSALRAALPRERLAGAYYLARGLASGGQRRALPPEDKAILVESAAWGLAQPSATAGQAAVDTLLALGHPLSSLGIQYHPYFKIELKQEAATRLLAWWAARR